MVLPVIIKDGHGSTNKVKVNGEGEIGVTIHAHPPIDEQIIAYPFSSWFENNTSNDMRVDGSTTNVEFSINANADVDIFIKTISVRISDNGAALNEFGALSALTNGVEWAYSNSGLGLVMIQDEIKTNLDFIRLGFDTAGTGDGVSAYRADVSGAGADTYLPNIDLAKTFGFPWGLRLAKNTTDKLVFIVKDDLSSGLDVFNIKAFGVQI